MSKMVNKTSQMRGRPTLYRSIKSYVSFHPSLAKEPLPLLLAPPPGVPGVIPPPPPADLGVPGVRLAGVRPPVEEEEVRPGPPRIRPCWSISIAEGSWVLSAPREF